MRVWSLISSGLRWKAVVAIDGGICGVCPILDIGAAGEEKGTYGLANGSDSTFCGAVELVNVGRRKIALYGRLVAQFEETCRHEFAAVLAEWMLSMVSSGVLAGRFALAILRKSEKRRVVYSGASALVRSG